MKTMATIVGSIIASTLLGVFALGGPNLADPISAAADPFFEEKTDELPYELTSPSWHEVSGRLLPGGTCEFAFPRLEGDAYGTARLMYIAPGESAAVVLRTFAPPETPRTLEAVEVATDVRTCTKTMVSGVRTQPKPVPTDGSEASEASSRSSRDGSVLREPTALSMIGDQISFEVRWEDAIDIDVTKTKSTLTWTWDNFCTKDGAGVGYWWWRSSTGWYRHSYGSTIHDVTTCLGPYPSYSAAKKVTTNGVFKNTAFPACIGTVTVYNLGVSVQGNYNGTRIAWVDNNYYVKPAACPPLHYHYTYSGF